MLTFFGIERGRDEEPVDVWPLGIAPFIRLADPDSGNRLIVDDGLFGLLPQFQAELAAGRKTYNARSETVHRLPSFRESWEKGWRCIIPVEHIYEPFYESAAAKAVRYRVQQPMAYPFGIAGIFRKWRHPDGRELFTFAMLTVNADDHPVWSRLQKPGDEKRMPIILDREEYGEWLRCPAQDAVRFFRQWRGTVEIYPDPLPARAPRADSSNVIRPPASGDLFDE